MSNKVKIETEYVEGLDEIYKEQVDENTIKVYIPKDKVYIFTPFFLNKTIL